MERKNLRREYELSEIKEREINETERGRELPKKIRDKLMGEKRVMKKK